MIEYKDFSKLGVVLMLPARYELAGAVTSGVADVFKVQGVASCMCVLKGVGIHPDKPYSTKEGEIIEDSLNKASVCLDVDVLCTDGDTINIPNLTYSTEMYVMEHFVHLINACVDDAHQDVLVKALTPHLKKLHKKVKQLNKR